MTGCSPSLAGPKADSLSISRGVVVDGVVVVAVVVAVAVAVSSVVGAIDDFFFFVFPAKFV